MRHLEIKQMPELPYAVEEAMNRLRINVGFCGKQYKKIIVISSEANEGKSFVTLNLWKMFAESGTASVLLDADMRNSALQEDYRLEVEGKKTGLSDYLSKVLPMDEVLYTTNQENGYLLPNFTNIVNPSLLLEGERFTGMLDELAERFEYVFVDCPPLNLVSDGERIGAMCDGAIFVIRADVTPKPVIRNSIAQLERAGCPLLGVVLNRAYARNGSYYSKYGKMYYGIYGRYGKYSMYGKKENIYYGKKS
jgi:capsular exopolysaccharide synthesis family protein